MNPASSKCSACDRCRGQKLRCVRSSSDECDRCRKAGSECINTLYSQKTRTGGAREREFSVSGRHATERPRSGHVARLSRGGSLSRGNSTAPLNHPTTFDRSSVMYDGLQGMGMQREETLHTFQHRPEHMSVDGPQRQPPNFDSGNLENELHDFFTSRTGNQVHSMRGSDPIPVGSFDGNMVLGRTSTALSNPETGTGSYGFDKPLAPPSSAAENHSATTTLNGSAQPSRQTLSSFSTHPLPQMNSVQDCVDCLLDLCSKLQRSANQYDKDRRTLPNLLSFSLGHPNPQASTTVMNAIGYALACSQDFLIIVGTLRGLLVKPAESGPGTPSTSECSYSDLWDDTELGIGAFADDVMTGVSIPSGSSGSALGSMSLSTKRSASSASMLPTSLDLPATLTTMTCYFRLLHTYDIIFSCISASIHSGEDVNTPSVIPGLNIGGFSFDEHKDMQTEVLIHLSESMLERIEASLGIDTLSTKDRKVIEQGILESASAGALLEMMRKHHEGGTCDALRVKRTMAEIRRAMRRETWA